MSRTLLTQNVIAWHKQYQGSQREGILYRRYPLDPNSPIPPDVITPCDWLKVRKCVHRIHLQVHDLVGRAVFGVEREASGVERPAHELASEILPPGGFIGLLEPGVHPILDVENDELCGIPWEALEEAYAICPKGGCRTDPRAAPTRFCQQHGCAMEPAGGKLVINHHLAYQVHGDGRATGRGKRFLIIDDPRNDLAAGSGDREGLVRDHVAAVRELLEKQGYDVAILAQSTATCDRVLDAVAHPELMGVYYFGHGLAPSAARSGCLFLADGELSAGEIDERSPTAPFVFLNACEAGALPASSGPDPNPPLSLANAFAKGGGGRVVIAPLWPIVSHMAADFALTFFRNACGGDTLPLAECLRSARKESLHQYNDGKPDTCWLSFRYFGDPNKVLGLLPQREETTRGRGVSKESPSRVFDGRHRVCTGVFGFDINAVLFRAAKRRTLQERILISHGDLIAGLTRTGELTRYVLEKSGRDPDALYRPLIEHQDPGQKKKNDDNTAREDTHDPPEEPVRKDDVRDALKRFVELFMVRSRDDFAPNVVALMLQADRAALKRNAGGASLPISEEDLLVSLLAAREWDGLLVLGFPSRIEVESILDQRQNDGLDANGFVSLDALDAPAQRVIQAAHTLAQQRGVFPITHRVLLAAFLATPDGYAARVCRAARTPFKPDVLCHLMRSIIDEADAKTFGLSRQACEPVVTPLLRAAQQMAAPLPQVNERALFMAFCETANPGFKQFLRKPPLLVDLDRLKNLPIPETNSPAEQSRTASDERDMPPADVETSASARHTDQTTADPGLDAETFEPAAWSVITNAETIARAALRPVVNSPHLFAAMLDAADGKLAASLAQHHVNREHLKTLVIELLPPASHGAPESHPLPWSPNTRAILGRSMDIARRMGRQRISNDDLVAAFFADGGGVIGQALMTAGLEALMRSFAGADGAIHAPREQATSLTDRQGVDLTEMARKGRLPAVVGREREVESVMQTLMLSESANPLLVGEAGVGKTAIVGGVAQRIVEGRCPKRLQAARIVELSAGNLVADTPLRGEFEKRLQQLLAEVKNSNTILFIDEIHTLVGAGSGGMGHLDAGNMLKSAMARGEIRIIGATTPPECRLTIERDKALARRFQKIQIRPPCRNDAIRMLASAKPRLEQHHEVAIAESAIEAAVDLSGRHIHDKQWPAKARDVLDRACVVSTATNAEPASPSNVKAEHVVHVIAGITGLPVEQISTTGLASLANLEERVAKRIVGQDAAIHTVAETIRRGRQGLTTGDRPWGVFLFAGPPGVGKTELAKVLADEVFGTPDGLIRFDMGDFTEPHSTARLVGSPPGYVGYDRGAPLVEKLRANPHSLILFDEIEQAHENVLATLLRLLSEGTINDSDGNVADARNAIVILTTNILGRASGGIGFAPPEGAATPPLPSDAAVRSDIGRHLPRNLLDRLDAMIRFNALTVDALTTLAAPAIREIAARLGAAHGMAFTVDDALAAWVAAKTGAAGARELQRTIDQAVFEPLSDFAASHTGQRGPFRVTIAAERLSVTAVLDNGEETPT